uniref:Uncharacterized protein n=1 Tax=Candidatus Kentrum sp. SD TaxID=2126332 RepID=A0A450Z7E4_9GAMM|nr:MAG: hypothetical protein BECKSD772E_GA0070983_12281 [Candidatus Kentron sp. SD]
MLLENPLERKMAFSDGFHDELNFTSIPDDATNCPVRGIMFNLKLSVYYLIRWNSIHESTNISRG